MTGWKTGVPPVFFVPDPHPEPRGDSRPRCPVERISTALSHEPEAYPYAMDKKEIESPKLTANFLVWISAFVLLLFLLIAHFVWRIF
jgi:hypothetical protein